MSKIVNIGNHSEKPLDNCTDKGVTSPLFRDPKDPCDNTETLKDEWLKNASNQKIGLGSAQKYDPMQSGQIVNDVESPQSNVVYRYSKSLRACDEAVQDLFKNIVVIDEDGKAHPVPIIWATQEKAVAAIVQDNVRKDNSLVVDRIRLPMLAVYSNDLQFNQSRYVYHKAIDYLGRYRTDGKPGFTTNEKYNRDTVFGVARGIPVDISYTLYAWTLYIEDMNQILEQIFTKFSPTAYINVRGVQQETIVKLNSTANNLNIEPGDQAIRVIKYQFNLTAESYISQPIRREKAVLKTKIDVFNSTEDSEMNEVVMRIEETVKELND